MENIKQVLEKVTKLNLQKPEHLPYSIIPFLYDRISSKELLHSEIISSFLNPKSNHQCGTHFLFNFFEMIQLDENDYKNETEFIIYTEHGVENLRRIDILITWKGKAIIIENKLNDAVDQTDQLKDYYIAVSKEFTVKKIVYIPRDQTKRAHLTDLDDKVKKLIVEIYPNDLIKWINKFPINADIKESCVSYSNTLKYMNLKNLNIMNSNQLLENLQPNELRLLIDLTKTINTNDWNFAVLKILKGKLISIDSEIMFTDKKVNCIEIFYKDFAFWVEIYLHTNDFDFGLWIVSKSNDNPAICSAINMLGFNYEVQEDNYFYYKNENKYVYKFPTEDNYKDLVKDIIDILKESKSL